MAEFSSPCPVLRSLQTAAASDIWRFCSSSSSRRFLLPLDDPEPVGRGGLASMQERLACPRTAMMVTLQRDLPRVPKVPTTVELIGFALLDSGGRVETPAANSEL